VARRQTEREIQVNRISLREWAEQHSLKLENGRLVVLATDGRSCGKDNPLGLGFMPVLGGEPTFIFVQGAQAAKAEPYTGVTEREYLERAVGEERFYELLREQLQGVEFFVSYWARLFIGQWFQSHTLLQGLSGMPLFDVVEYVKLIENNESIMPTTASTWEELCQRIQAPAIKGRGYGFEAVYNRVLGLTPEAGGAIFRNRLRDLHTLFSHLLVR